MTTQVTPTFLLKGINYSQLLEEYKSGYFSTIKPQAKITISKDTIILAPTYGKSNDDAIFSIKDKNNYDLIIATTEHKNYEIFKTTGENPCNGGRCDYCKVDFDQMSIGYPLAYKESSILMDDEIKAIYRTFYTFWIEGEFCSFECALEDVRRTQSRSSDYRDFALKDSESMLRMLYALIYPDEDELRPAKYYRLLKRNNGSLTEEEWKDPRHMYVRTARVLMIPAKTEYIKQKSTHSHHLAY